MEECRHIRINGTKCCAAALTSNAWCFFHDRIYKERAAQPQRRVFRQLALPADTLDYGCVPVTTTGPQNIRVDIPFELPLIEDISSVQFAISQILQLLAADSIDPKRAGLLLYGLQIAARNMPKDDLKEWQTVSQVGHTSDGTPVAIGKPGEPSNESFASLAARLRLNLKALKDLNEPPPAPRTQGKPKPSPRLEVRALV